MSSSLRPVAETFTAGSPTHAVAVALCLLGVAVLVLAARRASEPSERRIRLTLVWFVVLVQGFGQVWQNLPGRLVLEDTLPLHICDLVPWLGVLALLTGNRWCLALIWFWGIGLSPWALIMPDLEQGPSTLTFWVFWVGHAQIVACAAYLVCVRGYRPTGADLRRAGVALAVYAGILVPIDVWLGLDYGYVGQESTTAFLGPWPARIGVLYVGAMALFGLLLLPWTLARRHAARA